MISDWTIYGVIVKYPDGDYEGTFCVDCFKRDYGQRVADVVMEGLGIAAIDLGEIERWNEWINENSLTSVATLRSLWGRWGLPIWLADLVDDAFPDSFPAQPRISVELDWEDDCPFCDATGKVTDDDTDELIDCPDCDGYGVTGPRCDECEELL